MIDKSRSLTFYLILDAILFFLCIIGVYHISEKAALPFNLEHKGDGLYITELPTDNSDVQINDKLLEVLSYPVKNAEEVECILDGKNINKKVALTLQREDVVYKKELRTTPFYSPQYLLIATFVSISFFIIGIFVLIKRPEIKSAKLFHLGSISTGVIIATTWGNYNIEPLGMGYLIRIIFSAAYSFAPMLFIDFTLSLRKRERKGYKYIRPLLYLISLVLFLLQSASFIYFVDKETLVSIQIYLEVFSIFRVYLITYMVIGLLIISYTYKSTKEEYERKKLRWILFGFSIGLIGMISLWIMPYLFTSAGLIAEEFVLLIVLVIPTTFAISIVRYRWLDIDLIIKRSIVYSTVVLLLLLTYLLIALLITEIFNINNTDTTVPVVITVLLVALFVHPVNQKVRSFVNKKFFRIQYNFREVLNSLIDDIKYDNKTESIANKIIEKIEQVIPIEKVGFFLIKENEVNLNLIAHKDCKDIMGEDLNLSNFNKITEANTPLAKMNSVEPGAAVSSVENQIIPTCDFELAFSMKSESNSLIGIIVLGEKRAKTRFTLEDIDLLSTIASSAASAIERIKLHEELIKERLETERLEELNELKSLFVSTVSHDLKTPLTSIKLFSEILQNKKDIPDDKMKEYLQIIEGESDRLTRLINNVLDFAKIEKGIKEYKFEEVSLNGIVSEVLVMMEYQFRIKKFELDKSLTENEKLIYGDNDAIAEALINLLSNAIKYSDGSKTISVATFLKDEYYCISVEDHGIGIKETELANIIIPYFRSEDQLTKSESGTGLGLSIVKHIMNAHNGKIDITSRWQKGSTFTLRFPKGGNNEKNINN